MKKSRLIRFVNVGILALCVGMLAGCAGTKRAYQAAEGVDQNAKVVAEHYYALVREANDLKKKEILTGTALARAQEIVRTSRPAIDHLSTAARAYEGVQDATTEAELNAAIAEAAIAISELIDIIKAARGSSSISRENRGLAQYWPKTASQIAA